MKEASSFEEAMSLVKGKELKKDSEDTVPNTHGVIDIGTSVRREFGDEKSDSYVETFSNTLAVKLNDTENNLEEIKRFVASHDNKAVVLKDDEGYYIKESIYAYSRVPLEDGYILITDGKKEFNVNI